MAVKQSLGLNLSLAILLPHTAYAHDFFGDTQPLLNGVAHPFLTVPHLLLLLVLGLALLSQTRPKWFLGVFLIAFVLGLIGQWFLPNLFLDSGFSLLLALFGILVAYYQPIPFKVLSFPLALCGFLLGLDTLPESREGVINLVFFLGTTFGIFALFSYAVLLKDFIKQEWQWVVVRTLGGWMFAIGLMMVAFSLSKVV